MTFSTSWNHGWLALMVNHLWQSTLVVLLAWLLTLALNRNEARSRYWVWMVASVKLLVPFSLFISIGELLRPVAAVPVRSAQFAPAIVSMTQPFSPSTQPAISDLFRSRVPVPAPHDVDLLPAIFLTVWLCGFVLLLIRWARNWRAIRAVVRSASPMSLSMDIPVLSSSRLLEPAVFGIFHPVLLLPEKIVSRLSTPQLHSILAHEMSHVRRGDNLTAAIHMTVETIFWFHPAVWLIESRLVEERERACDEAVLQLGNEAEAYAESILNVCKFYTESPMACMSGVTGSDLKRRIVRIMTEQTGRKLDVGRKLLLSVAAVMAVAMPVTFGLVHATQARAQSAPANPASDIAAIWQGTLHTGRDLRFAIKVTKADHGTLQATFYNVDGEPGGIPAISITMNGSLLKLDLPFGTYEGTVSADGNSIAGTWRQGSNPLPLNFVRATPATEWTIPQPPQRMTPMAANADPTFEVASIKPSRPEEQGPRFWFQQRRFSVIHTSVSNLVKFAFKLQQSQLAAVPDWVTSENYDIFAEPDGEGEPSIKQWQSMVKKLMADRFQLRFHYEKRELSVYILTLAKTGPKMASTYLHKSAYFSLGPVG
jgi:beta-lactamase regulating signal transducer with metallopeptidase domain